MHEREGFVSSQLHERNAQTPFPREDSADLIAYSFDCLHQFELGAAEGIAQDPHDQFAAFGGHKPAICSTTVDLHLISSLAERFPRAAELMLEASEDVLAFRHFPPQHWKKVWSTNLLERVNEEIKRRTLVVGIFPNDAAI